jgi:hypothetical protein
VYHVIRQTDERSFKYIAFPKYSSDTVLSDVSRGYTCEFSEVSKPRFLFLTVIFLTKSVLKPANDMLQSKPVVSLSSVIISAIDNFDAMINDDA